MEEQGGGVDVAVDGKKKLLRKLTWLTVSMQLEATLVLGDPKNCTAFCTSVVTSGVYGTDCPRTAARQVNEHQDTD